MTGRAFVARAHAQLRDYKPDKLRDDLIAALIVTVLLLPQSLAYALLAGLPPVVGVLASLLPLLAYAALGSSSTLAVGPVAVLALMCAQASLPVAQAFGLEPHLVAVVLATEMAVFLFLAALLRLDALAALLSVPVLHGFISGAAIAIAISQLPGLLGLAAGGNSPVEMVRAWLSRPVWPHAATAAVGIGAALCLYGIRRWGVSLLTSVGLTPTRAQLAARVAPVGVVLASIVWVTQAGDSARGVALAGQVGLAQALHFPLPWQAPHGVWMALLGPAGLLALVAYVESLAMAQALAARRGEKIIPRRELFGLSAANAAAGLSGGMPVAGSFTRSAVNRDAGASTRMAGVWTALFLAIAIWLLGDLLGFLPKAVLAATIIIAVLSLLHWEPFAQAWRFSKPEFGVMAGVGLLTLLAGVEIGLLTGVLLSVALLLQKGARPHWAEVGRLPGTDVFRNIKRFAVETSPRLLMVRIDESLVFTNSPWLSEQITDLLQRREGVRHVVLMFSAVNHIDFSGLQSLKELADALSAAGMQLHLSEVKGPLRDLLAANRVSDWLTGEMFDTQLHAYRTLGGKAPSE
jgi:sulfate permease, SulP family